MKLKYFLTNVLHIGQPARQNVPARKAGLVRAKQIGRVTRGRFVDLETLRPSQRPTEEEIRAKVRKGRVAEMSMYHAGLE